MSNKNNYKQGFVFGLTAILVVVSFSGCIENNNSIDETILSSFIGTWSGNLISTFKGRTANITDLTFIENTVDVTMKSDRGTQIMTYIYSVEGDKLVLEAKFDNGRSADGREPPEGGQSNIPTSFVYSFNLEYDVLNLDSSKFIKTN
jgi:hypothetical protein